jgi:hypothetical protein
MECWADFKAGLSPDNRTYPIQQFKALGAMTKRYTFSKRERIKQ